MKFYHRLIMAIASLSLLSSTTTAAIHHPKQPQTVHKSTHKKISTVKSSIKKRRIPTKTTPKPVSLASTSTLPLKVDVDGILKSAPADLKPEVVKLAATAYENAEKRGLAQSNMLSIIDFSLPSNQKRLWVYDLNTNKLLIHTYVTHGKGSGSLYAKNFSNRDGSHQSSIGVYTTAETYYGHDGYSLRLDGLERGFNDKARQRAIVIHGATYAEDSVAKSGSRLGLSWGCPAVPKHLASRIINTIKGGSIVFAYYPDNNWLSHSEFLT